MILGNLDVERLPVFSFLIHHPATGYYLHHNVTACILNDVFGIQARGGCACAGPYAMVSLLFVWLVGWLVGRLVGRSVGWSVGWLVGRLIVRSVG
jgi:hypothetical protein